MKWNKYQIDVCPESVNHKKTEGSLKTPKNAENTKINIFSDFLIQNEELQLVMCPYNKVARRGEKWSRTIE